MFGSPVRGPFRKVFELNPPWVVGEGWSRFEWHGFIVALARNEQQDRVVWNAVLMSTDAHDVRDRHAQPQANATFAVRTRENEGPAVRSFLEQVDALVSRASEARESEDRSRFLEKFKSIGRAITESVDYDDEFETVLEPLYRLNLSDLRRPFRGLGFSVSIYRRRTEKELCLTATPRTLDRRITVSDMQQVFNDFQRYFNELSDLGGKGYRVTVICDTSKFTLTPGMAMPRGAGDRIYVTIKHDPTLHQNEVNGYGDGLPDALAFSGYT